MALMESGKDFEYVNVDMAKGEHKSAAFLKMQPFGKVPVLKEGDDFVLFESRAIMKYVLAGTSLCPGDAKEAALVESAISVEYSYFSPAFLPAYYQRVVNKKKGFEPDEAKVAASIEALGPVLDIVESLLEGKSFMAGNSFTMADARPAASSPRCGAPPRPPSPLCTTQSLQRQRTQNRVVEYDV